MRHFRNVSFWFCVIALLPASRVIAQAGAGENQGVGPIQIQNQYFFALLHTSLRPTRASTLAEDESVLRTGFSWSNTAVAEDNFVTDVETRVLDLSVQRGISDRTEVGLRIPLVWRGGGRLDRFIDSWHRDLSLPRGDRRRLDDDNFEVSGRNSDGSHYHFSQEGWALGEVELSSKYLLSAGDGESPTVALEGGIGLPTARASFGQRALDFSLSLFASKRIGRYIIYSGAGAFFYTDTSVNGVQFLPVHFEGFVQGEYQWTDTWSLNIGLYSSSKTVDDIRGHPGYSLYLDCGVQKRLSENTIAQVLLRENPAPGSGTVDVTFLGGVSRTF